MTCREHTLDQATAMICGQELRFYTACNAAEHAPVMRLVAQLFPPARHDEPHNGSFTNHKTIHYRASSVKPWVQQHPGYDQTFLDTQSKCPSSTVLTFVRYVVTI